MNTEAERRLARLTDEDYRFWKYHTLVNGGPPEACEENNARQRAIIETLRELHGSVVLVKFNPHRAEEKEKPLKQYVGGPVFNFDADAVLPDWDSGIEALLKSLLGRERRKSDDIILMSEVIGKIHTAGGRLLAWT